MSKTITIDHCKECKRYDGISYICTGTGTKCDGIGIPADCPVGDDEKEIISRVNAMCSESCSPDIFDMWEKVKDELCANRRGLKP